MLSTEDHNTLKSILLYQAVLEYLQDREVVKKMEADELESFQAIIMECFNTCNSYNGTIPDIKEGCTQLLSTKEDIIKFCPKVDDILTKA